MLVQLSSHLIFILCYNFSSTVTELKRHLVIFLWLTYCKSEVEVSSQQKVMEGIIAEETTVEGPLVEGSADEKMVVTGMLKKKLEVD